MIHSLAASLRRNNWCIRAGLLATCLFATSGAYATGAAPLSSGAKSSNAAASPLSVKIYADRMTVAVAGAPQVYLYGSIDIDAPQRFADLVKSRKILPGSDVYLNATGDNIDAGIALGRLIRDGAMSTHLGRPTRTRREKMGDKSSICTGACAYAYLGGVYRWAPAGRDRFGIAAASAVDPKNTDATQAAERVSSYLKDMGVAATAFTTLRANSAAPTVWPTADQMISSGLSNNGHQPLVAGFQMETGVPSLDLKQTGRHGEQRLTLQCRPGSVSLTAYNKVKVRHAQQIIGHAARSYIAVDQKETLSKPRGDGIRLAGDTLIVERTYPSSQLQSLLSAKSIGAWISQQNSPLRYGFAFGLYGIDRTLNAFHDACGKDVPKLATPNA
ncbi:MAG: hypothetical protein ABI114_17425 [Rhodanobacter sp.]